MEFTEEQKKAMGRTFHKICKQRGIKPKKSLALWDEIRAENEPSHGPDCRDFGIEDGCPVCDAGAEQDSTNRPKGHD